MYTHQGNNRHHHLSLVGIDESERVRGLRQLSCYLLQAISLLVGFSLASLKQLTVSKASTAAAAAKHLGFSQTAEVKSLVDDLLVRVQSAQRAKVEEGETGEIAAVTAAAAVQLWCTFMD